MELKQINLHNKNVQEALDDVQKSIKWIVEHDEVGSVFVHGKGLHGTKGVVKQEVRRYLEIHESELNENGYIVLKGEDEFPITESLDAGVVVVIKSGYENESYGSGGQKQREKNYVVYNEDGKALRKNKKKNPTKSRHQERPRNEQVSGKNNYCSQKKSRAYTYPNHLVRSYSSKMKDPIGESNKKDLYTELIDSKIVWNSEHLDSIDATLAIRQNPLNEFAALGKIFDVSNCALYIESVYKDFDKVEQLPSEMIKHLSQDVRDLTLLHSEMPKIMFIKSPSCELISEFSHCKIGDIVLMCKLITSSQDVINPHYSNCIMVFSALSFQMRPLKKGVEKYSYVRNMLEDMPKYKYIEENQIVGPKIIGRVSLEEIKPMFIHGAYRLGRVASQHNVSKNTIVEFLQHYGFHIENSPNTKLTDEMYNIICREFSLR